MADTTRSAQVVRQTYTFGDRRFIGINTNIQANSLEDGYVQDAVNLWNDGGALVVRPGWQAQLTSTTGLYNNYEPIAYRQSDNASNTIIYAEGIAGGTTANIRKFTAGGSTQTLLGSVTADPSKVRMVQYGKYIYGVPGEGGGNIFRTDGTTLEVIPTVKPAYKNGTDLITPYATPVTAPIRPIGMNAVSTQFTISNPSLVASNAFVANEPIVFPTSTDTNIVANRIYYVRATGLSSSAFQVSTTSGGVSSVSPSATATFNAYSIKGIENDNGSAVFGPTFVGTSYYEMIKQVNDGIGYTFETETAGNAPSLTFWPTQTGSPTIKTVNGSGSLWFGGSNGDKIRAYNNTGSQSLLLDKGGDSILSQIRAVPTYTYNGETKTCGLFQFKCVMFNNDSMTSPRNQSVRLTVTGYDSTSTSLAGNGCIFIQNISPVVAKSTSDWQVITVIVDFRPFASTLSKISVKLETGNPAQGTGSDRGIFVDNVGIWGIVQHLAPNPSDVLNTSNLVKMRCYQMNTLIAPYAAGYLKNVLVKVTGFTSTDLSKRDTISIRMEFPTTLQDSLPYMSLGIQNTGATGIEWTQYGTYEPNKGYMTWNIYGMPQAKRNNVANLFVRMETEYANILDNSEMFAMGEVVYNGNLTADADYEYTFTRWYSSDQTNLRPPTYRQGDVWQTGLETLPANVSNSIHTTDAFSGATVVINPQAVPASDLQWDTYPLTMPSTFTGTTSNGVTDINLVSTLAVNDYVAITTTIGTGAGQLLNTTYYYVTATTGTTIRLSLTLGGTAITPNASAAITVVKVPSDFVTTNVPSANQISVISASAGTLLYKDTSGNTYTQTLTANVPLALSSNIKFPISFSGSTAIWLRHSPSYTTGTTQKYSHILVYRRASSVFPDGRFRLIAVVPINAPSSGSNWTSTTSSVTSSGTWNEITFFDNVPDGDLFYLGAPYDQGQFFEPGRDQMPSGASAIAIHQKRLWVSRGNMVYGSWVLNFGNEYSLYTTLVPDASDPGHDAKGTSFTLSSTYDNEKVIALLSYGGDSMFFNNSTSAAMLVIRERSVYPLLGWDPSTFTIQSMVTEASTGCVSPRAAISMYGAMVWQSPIGVVQYTEGTITPKSTELRKMLSLDKTTGAPDLSAAAYRNISFAMHNGRLFVFAPGVGDSNNTYVYVFDTRTQGWTRWRTIPSSPVTNTIPTSFVGFTGGVSLSFGNDQADFYAFANNGQIYKLSGTVDKIDTNTSKYSIYWYVTSRQYGQTYSEGIAYYNQNRVSQLDIHLFTGTTTAVTCSFSGPNISGVHTFEVDDIVVLSKDVATGVTVDTYYVVATIGPSLFTVKNLDGSTPASGSSGTCTATLSANLLWQVQDQAGVAKHGSGVWRVTGNANKTAAIRNVNRDVLATVMQIQLSGWTKLAQRMYASHIHCMDARIPRTS